MILTIVEYGFLIVQRQLAHVTMRATQPIVSDNRPRRCTMIQVILRTKIKKAPDVEGKGEQPKRKGDGDFVIGDFWEVEFINTECDLFFMGLKIALANCYQRIAFLCHPTRPVYKRRITISHDQEPKQT